MTAHDQLICPLYYDLSPHCYVYAVIDRYEPISRRWDHKSNVSTFMHYTHFRVYIPHYSIYSFLTNTNIMLTMLFDDVESRN